MRVGAQRHAGPPNQGMKLSKPEYLGGREPFRSGIIEAGFAAYAQCSADQSGCDLW